jgi:PAS domain S-box-containing protein
MGAPFFKKTKFSPVRPKPANKSFLIRVALTAPTSFLLQSAKFDTFRAGPLKSSLKVERMKDKHLSDQQPLEELEYLRQYASKLEMRLFEGEKLARMGTFEYLISTGEMFWSQGQFRIYGLAPRGPAPAYDFFVKECIYPEDAAMFEAACTSAIKNISTYDLEHRIVRPDGSVGWVHGRAKPCFDQSGKLIRYFGATVDITESKIAEEALSKNRAKLQAVLAAMTDAVCICDTEGKFIDFNEAFASFFGFDQREKCVGSIRDLHEILEVFTPGGKPATLEECAASRALRGETATGVEYTLRRKDTGKTWVAGYSFGPIRDKGAAIVAAVVSARDITEQKRVQETLTKSEQRFRELAENIRDVFWVATPDQLSYLSPVSEEIWGVDRSRLYENPASFLEMVFAEHRESVRQAYVAGFEKKEPSQIEFGIIRKDQTRRWNRARAFPVREHGRVVRTVGIVEDITTAKEAEELVRIQRDLAFRLGSASTLSQALSELLETCLEIDPFDSGGIFLIDAQTGTLELLVHRGVYQSLAKLFSTLGSRSAIRGEPGYWSNPRELFGDKELLALEGIKAFAEIPVKSQGEVVAVLDLASHKHWEISQNVRGALELIGAQIGGVLSRLQLMDTIREQDENLRQANSGLKVFLRQREADRVELEQSLMTNIKHLILPYLAKIKESSLDSSQKNLLELLESNLRAVASPFVRKISDPLLGLTSMEIRVADLIREGKSTKEISDLLGHTEHAVIFHRHNIRKKLGLRGKKVNLQTYLTTLLS